MEKNDKNDVRASAAETMWKIMNSVREERIKYCKNKTDEDILDAARSGKNLLTLPYANYEQYVIDYLFDKYIEEGFNIEEIDYSDYSDYGYASPVYKKVIVISWDQSDSLIP